LARARDQFRRSDVKAWGAAALLCVGAAVVSATTSAALPGSLFHSLHLSRLDAPAAPVATAPVVAVQPVPAQTVAAQKQIAAIESEEARLRAANADLQSKLEQATAESHALVQRVGALEASLPKLADAISARPAVVLDPSIVTGSIGLPASRFAGGLSGSASVEADATALQAMPEMSPAASSWAAAYMVSPAATRVASLAADVPTAPVPLAARRPDPIVEAAIAPVRTAPPDAVPAPATSTAGETTATAKPDVRAIGVAIGAPVPPATALVAWQGLAAKVGILLVGTSPLLADDPAGGDGKVLVAGPLPDIATAGKLCASIDRAGLTCTPMPYVGSPLQAAVSD
jgi:hypothetical protein